MKIAKWTEQPNGDFAWVIDGRQVVGAVHFDNGVWRTWWQGIECVGGRQSRLSDEFRCAHDAMWVACLSKETATGHQPNEGGAQWV